MEKTLALLLVLQLAAAPFTALADFSTPPGNALVRPRDIHLICSVLLREDGTRSQPTPRHVCAAPRDACSGTPIAALRLRGGVCDGRLDAAHGDERAAGKRSTTSDTGGVSKRAAMSKVACEEMVPGEGGVQTTEREAPVQSPFAQPASQIRVAAGENEPPARHKPSIYDVFWPDSTDADTDAALRLGTGIPDGEGSQDGGNGGREREDGQEVGDTAMCEQDGEGMDGGSRGKKIERGATGKEAGEDIGGSDVLKVVEEYYDGSMGGGGARGGGGGGWPLHDVAITNMNSAQEFEPSRMGGVPEQRVFAKNSMDSCTKAPNQRISCKGQGGGG